MKIKIPPWKKRVLDMDTIQTIVWRSRLVLQENSCLERHQTIYQWIMQHGNFVVFLKRVPILRIVRAIERRRKRRTRRSIKSTPTSTSIVESTLVISTVMKAMMTDIINTVLAKVVANQAKMAKADPCQMEVLQSIGGRDLVAEALADITEVQWIGIEVLDGRALVRQCGIEDPSRQGEVQALTDGVGKDDTVGILGDAVVHHIAGRLPENRYHRGPILDRNTPGVVGVNDCDEGSAARFRKQNTLV